VNSAEGEESFNQSPEGAKYVSPVRRAGITEQEGKDDSIKYQNIKKFNNSTIQRFNSPSGYLPDSPARL
jgi:hypothetical protein